MGGTPAGKALEAPCRFAPLCGDRSRAPVALCGRAKPDITFDLESDRTQHGFHWSGGNAALSERTSIYGSMAGICAETLDRVSVVRPYAPANSFLASLK